MLLNVPFLLQSTELAMLLGLVRWLTDCRLISLSYDLSVFLRHPLLISCGCCTDWSATLSVLYLCLRTLAELVHLQRWLWLIPTTKLPG